MNLTALFQWRRPRPSPVTMTQVPQTKPVMVTVEYFDNQKRPQAKVMTLDKYAELLTLAITLKGDESLSLNQYLETL